ncbi:hypothetical protein [Pseudalkalibacillus berkeleyi]|uniref:Uncharacterized protein n=1 Tax=Pseudalkalibacillus berkeleyi TaxID=1069813 RepID=A0ABS9H140_9BACL|nr:hypothetical protein [Pseudalkalibacillus berkeleyi]MCF6137609.1 hypothetical protein [Pseudalkalibacillus berkeleyi]
MTQQDQATRLREKVKSTSYGPDVMELPPRSEKHGVKNKSNQKETIQSSKLHIWITRSIVLAFLGLLVFTILYFTNVISINVNMPKETDQLIDIDR